MEQLVWQAFERQGHELLHTVELGASLGVMRVIIREGKKAALWCVGNGALFETATVERFVQSMRSTNVDQGFLVAAGSFTIPAQRYASAQGVSLLGREQLIELIGTGAVVTSYTKQLDSLTQQLTEAKATIEEYGRQLDALRQQRNEASWYLGEERVKSSQLEARLTDLAQQVQEWKVQAEQMTVSADAAKKQWQESQWYLGEATTSLDHLQEEMQRLRHTFDELTAQHHHTVTALRQVEGQRDEATGALEEAKRALQQQLHQVEEQVRQAQAQLDAMQQLVKDRDTQLDTERRRRIALEEELKTVRSAGERRQYPRISPEAFTAELQDYGGTPLYRGHVRDLSLRGFGVDTPIPLDFPATLPVRARLTWPGCRRPLESEARLAWKRQDEITQRYQQGFELEGMSERARAAMLRAFPTLQPRSSSTRRASPRITRSKSKKRTAPVSS
ncbi:MAG: PilZ domain-containing protein [Candidatus Omnitrophica bacterium]|nr:PilZ domain-containing protein [Candidatus Omnitrophota bacterium]